MNKPRIIFLTSECHPYASSVGKCVWNIALETVKQFDVSVICHQTSSELPEVEKFMRIDLIRIQTPDMNRRIFYKERISKSQNIVKFFYQILFIIHRILHAMKLALLPETIDKMLVCSYFSAINRIPGSTKVLVPACLPFETLVASVKYIKRSDKKSTRMIPILFDMFSANRILNRGNCLMKMKFKNNLRMEKEVFERSSAILFVPQWKNHLAYYFNEFQMNAHMIEHPLLLNLDLKSHESIWDKKDCNILYAGIVDKEYRPPDYALRIFDKISSQVPAARFHFFTYGSAQSTILNYAKKNNGILFHGKVPQRESMAGVAQANLLVSLGNYRLFQTPGKIFEYMATGKPLVHFYHDESDMALDILQHYPNACLLRQDEESFAWNMAKLSDFINNLPEPIPFYRVAELFKTACPGYSAQIIRQQIENMMLQ